MGKGWERLGGTVVEVAQMLNIHFPLFTMKSFNPKWRNTPSFHKALVSLNAGKEEGERSPLVDLGGARLGGGQMSIGIYRHAELHFSLKG